MLESERLDFIDAIGINDDISDIAASNRNFFLSECLITIEIWWLVTTFKAYLDGEKDSINFNIDRFKFRRSRETKRL